LVSHGCGKTPHGDVRDALVALDCCVRRIGLGVSDHALPPDVARFLRTEMDAIEELDVLLLLQEEKADPRMSQLIVIALT
jgi:hypothetical protein